MTLKDPDKSSLYGLAIGLSANIAIGGKGATWEGVFRNLMIGPFTFFWSPGDGRLYGVDFGVPPAGFGFGFGYYETLSTPELQREPLQ